MNCDNDPNPKKFEELHPTDRQISVFPFKEKIKGNNGNQHPIKYQLGSWQSN